MNWRLSGAPVSYATTVFASGTGPLSELIDGREYAPYKSKEEVILCTVTMPGGTEGTWMTLTCDEISKYEQKGAKVTWYCYANYTYTDKVESETGEKTEADWTVDEGLRTYQSYELEESNKLPDLRVYDSNGNYTTYNEQVLNVVKDELLQGHGVSVTYYADQSGTYLNKETYAQCVDTALGTDHGVTIVGWDDSYPADNFVEGHKPAGNGAFIVKNSWGADTEKFPNKYGWGVKNDDGVNTGYFYLSYYDQTISCLETFDFDLSGYTEEEDYIIDQYDYLPSNSDLSLPSETEMSTANVFTADADMAIRTLTCETAKPNTDVTFKVYVLNEGATSPTDGTLAYSNEDSPAFYDMSGYHRLAISEDSDEWVRVREGQRYSVVVTQQCRDDSKYYLMIGRNFDEEYCRSQGIATYYEGVVNKGESYTNYKTASADTWEDWAPLVKSLESVTNFACDNFPIKAYASIRDYASVESLSELQAGIDAAKAQLAAYVVSADGGDVAAGSLWVTQVEYDALAAAIAEAEAILAGAGADWQTTLASTTPDQQTVDDAVAALGEATSTHTAAAKAGTKQEAKASEQAAAATEPVAQAAAASEPGARIPQTGDDTSYLLPVVLAVAGVVLVVVAVVVIRHRG